MLESEKESLEKLVQLLESLCQEKSCVLAALDFGDRELKLALFCSRGDGSALPNICLDLLKVFGLAVKHCSIEVKK